MQSPSVPKILMQRGMCLRIESFLKHMSLSPLLRFLIVQSIVCLFVCCLTPGTSALFRPLIVEVEHTRYVKNDQLASTIIRAN